MLIHYANESDVSEFARHFDWPIKPGITLENHLRSVLEVCFNERDNLTYISSCQINSLAKRGHTELGFDATLKQINMEEKKERIFHIKGFMQIYTRVELHSTTTEGMFHIAKQFSHIMGEEIELK